MNIGRRVLVTEVTSPVHRNFAARQPTSRSLRVVDAEAARVSTNPFVTSELVATRAEQRRTLRRIPARTVLTVYGWSVKPPAVSDPIDRAAVEIELRRVAREAIVNLLPVLATFEVVEFGDVMVRYFADLVRQRSADLSLGPPHVAAMRDKLVQLFFEDAEAVRARRDSVAHVQLDEERAAALIRLTLLLLAADELADDGYRDPRLD